MQKGNRIKPEKYHYAVFPFSAFPFTNNLFCTFSSRDTRKIKNFLFAQRKGDEKFPSRHRMTAMTISRIPRTSDYFLTGKVEKLDWIS